MFASRGTQPKQRKAIVLATCLGCSSLSIVAGFPQIHDQCGTGTELQQVSCASQRPSHWEPPSPPRTQRKCLGVGVCLPLPLSAALPSSSPPLALSTPFWNKCNAFTHCKVWLAVWNLCTPHSLSLFHTRTCSICQQYKFSGKGYH